MNKLRLFFCTLLSLAACTSPHSKRTGTADFAVGGIARIAGRITSAAGAPLDSVSVRVYLEPHDALYGTPEVFTDANGDYSLAVTRMGAALSDDSLVHQAIVIMRLARLDTPNAAGPIFRDSLDITFFRPRSVSRVTKYDYVVTLP